ncbi:10539_t:CDS:2 [Gigaspora margarita]|uniref:10539_t:CDS:1 n=1 Tax=Gigaspora margarita TaxID=4874 RepID=A0ABN7UN05_GIGMA|nr:10539_t:CDS:2 [Gigaspora margarita]
MVKKRPTLRTQKCNKNEQDTSSSVSKKASKYNEKQQNNNIAKQLSKLSFIKNINQRRKDYDDATSTNHKNNNIFSQVSSSDDESDNDSIPLYISLPTYKYNETILPHLVSSAHENNETTSPHPVSSAHETDVSLLQKNDIALPAHISGNIIGFDLATNIRNRMMTRVDEGDKEHITASVSSILHKPTLKLPEIDQVCKITKADPRLGFLVRDVAVVKLANEFRALNESAEEPYDELNEFVTNDVWKQLLQIHLKATDQTKLKKESEIFIKLKIFVHQVIKAVLIA